ncbi:MAG: hypothetical protein R3E66_02525 [bacterium]
MAETVYLVADSTSTLSDENFELFAEVLLPNCSPGDQICDIDGATLRYCNSLGLYEAYVCDGGCAGTECVNPRGEVCADAILLSDGDTYTGSYGSFKSDIDPGVGTCVLFDLRQQDGLTPSSRWTWFRVTAST